MADKNTKISFDFDINDKNAKSKIDELIKSIKEYVRNLKSLSSSVNSELSNAFKSKNVELFNGHLKKAENNFKTLVSESNKLNRNLDNTSNKVEKVSSKFEKFGKMVKTYLGYRIISGVYNAVTDLTQSMVELDSAFAKIQAITRATDEDMSKLQSTIYRVGANSKFSLQELSEGAVILGQAGLSAQEVNEVLETTNQLAMATSSSLESSVDVMTSAIAVWGLNTEDAIRLSDAMVTGMNKSKATLDTFRYGIQYAGNIASKASVSFEETFASLTLLADGGMKSSTAATSLRNVLNNLLAPSDKLKRQFKAIGLTEEDLDIQTNGFVNVLRKLRDAGIDGSVALELFGVRGGTAYASIYTHLDEMEEMIRAMQEHGSTAEASAIQMDTLSAQWNRFKNIITSDASAIAQAIKFIIIEPIKLLNGLLELLDSFIKKLGEIPGWVARNPLRETEDEFLNKGLSEIKASKKIFLKGSAADTFRESFSGVKDELIKNKGKGRYSDLQKHYTKYEKDSLDYRIAKRAYDLAIESYKKDIKKPEKPLETPVESERTKEIKEKLKNLSSKPKGKMAKTDPELEAFKLRSTSATYESVLEEAERKGAQARLAFLDKSGTLSGAYSKTSSDVEELQAMRDAVTQKQILEDMKNKYSEVYEKVKLGNISIQEADRLNNNRISTILDLEKSVAEAEGRFGDLDNVDLSKLDKQIDNLKTKLEKIAKSGESPLAQLKEGFKVTIEDMKNQVTFASLGQTIANDLNTGMVDALYNLTSGAKSFKESFSDMAKSIIDDISKMLIKMAVYQAMAAGLNWLGGPSAGSSNPTGSVLTPAVPHAQGGMITGGIANRDSVHAMLMPGEYVLKKSAVDALGTNFLNDLNNNAAQTLAGTAAALSNNESESSSEPSIVNVWVVSKEENAQMGPNDVITTISKDILTGGQTKRLIQSVVAGRK